MRLKSRLPNSSASDRQAAWADAEDEAAVEHVIQHRDVGRDGRRMGVRHVDRAGSQPDLFGGGRNPRQERHAGGDVLRLVGDVFPDIGLGKSKFVRKQERFAILSQRLAPVLVQGMDRHGEEAQFHRAFPTFIARSVQSTDCELLEK